jgi:hypothetical protein
MAGEVSPDLDQDGKPVCGWPSAQSHMSFRGFGGILESLADRE